MDSKRITALREVMKREGIDYYYIPTADFHESEYVVDYFKARKYIQKYNRRNNYTDNTLLMYFICTSGI